MAIGNWPPIDPSDTDKRHAVFCDRSGLNDGSNSDDGALQGETISTIDSVTVTSGTLTVDSSNKNSTTIQDITYAVDTVVNVWLSAGTAGDCVVAVEVTTSDSRTLNRSFTIEVRDL
jgi:hypothetical protein